MRFIYILLSLALSAKVFAQKPTLYIFYDPECPICQACTGRLQKLYDNYNKQVKFQLVYPTKGVTRKVAKVFHKEYKLSIPYRIDTQHQIVEKLNARTTPEVFLVNNKNQILYTGAIDDQFFELGKARTKPIERYLENALQELLVNKPISITKTTAIGCMLNRRKQ